MGYNYRWEHIRSVTSLALWLATETGADPEIVEAAAWLHDIRKGDPNHGVAGAKEAKKILERTDFPAEKIPVVVDAMPQTWAYTGRLRRRRQSRWRRRCCGMPQAFETRRPGFGGEHEDGYHGRLEPLISAGEPFLESSQGRTRRTVEYEHAPCASWRNALSRNGDLSGSVGRERGGEKRFVNIT
ncbi:MAG: HD domain-containing protein [Anaerolineales bacterium]|nr:HD domain-containing protein [Anaerolineales bacterium]